MLRTCAAAGDAAAADARSGRKTVDLDGLSFAQGGHLNTNKNTNLPPGSTRTTDKVQSVVLEWWYPVECLNAARLTQGSGLQLHSLCFDSHSSRLSWWLDKTDLKHSFKRSSTMLHPFQT
jgi:hypothetical protein